MGQIISSLRSSNQKTGQVIDGFVARPFQSKAADNRHHVKSSEVHKRTEKTRTLMRGGLKRPQYTPGITQRHPRVERFGNPAKSSSNKGQPAFTGQTVSRRPLNRANSSAAAAAPLPSMITSASHQKLERLLDEALTKADAHQQALRYHAARHFWQRRWFRGPRKWAIAAIMASALSAGGLYAWRNVPQVSIRAASFRARFSATVPTYKPDGYRVGGAAKAVSGAVSIQYKSSADQSKTYDITEQPSDLTSGMVSQDVIPKGAVVQTAQVQGNTVYIYGSAKNAAWVNNGVLYTITNHSGLRSVQLVNIVSGLNP